MTEYVFRVVDDMYEIYLVEDATEILSTFGKVHEVTRYRLSDPVDITDQVNGNYYYD
jgi:hypothetical protein